MRYLLTLICSLFFLATQADAQSGYRLKTGDTLSVEVLEDPSLNRSLLVLPDGTVTFPFAGSIRASGRTVAQIQQDITSSIAPNFAAAPNVFVTVAGLRPKEPAVPFTPPEPETIAIFFLGEINNPGRQEFEPGVTFLQAIAQSGGFTNFAATKRVQLRRTGLNGQPMITTINYRALSRGAQLASDIVMSDGDVILVPERRLFE